MLAHAPRQRVLQFTAGVDIAMGISDKTRKILWGPSGNRCAICRRELVVDAIEIDDESVVGDECHIVSASPLGPRHLSGWTREQYDSVTNLILLCRVHHKQVDDQFETYTVELLQHIKRNHHRWVKERLTEEEAIPPVRIRRLTKNIPEYLVRVTSGREILGLMQNSCASLLDHDELESDEEVALVGAFLQDVHDWGELANEMEPAGYSEAAFSLSKTVKHLEAIGFFVFGGREIQRVEGGIKAPMPWPVAILRVLRANNPAIIALDSATQSSSNVVGQSESDV